MSQLGKISLVFKFQGDNANVQQKYLSCIIKFLETRYLRNHKDSIFNLKLIIEQATTRSNNEEIVGGR